MRLTKNNIKFVKSFECNGIIYCWFVVFKSANISDSREYINYENGRTVVKEYNIDKLPASVRSFINEHEYSIFSDIDKDNGYIEYIYK